MSRPESPRKRICTKEPQKECDVPSVSKETNIYGSECHTNKENILPLDDSTPVDAFQMSDEDESDIEFSSIEDTIEIQDLIDAIITSDSNSISNHGNTDITISYDCMDSMVIESLVHFAYLFGINIVHDHENENATYLIVKIFESNSFYRSVATGNALVKHMPIVTLKWVIECLKSNTLLAIDSFMPIDISDVPSPSISWSVGQNYMNSKFDWTKRLILYFHSSVEKTGTQSYSQSWARKLGFVIADDFESFKNDDYELRIVLVDRNAIKNGGELPRRNKVLDWVRDYQALTVSIEWLFECLFQYKFIEIKTSFMPVQIPKTLAFTSGLYGYYEIIDEL